MYIYVYISERIVKRCCDHILGWFIWNADLSQVVKSWRIFVGTNQAEERQWTSCSDSGHRPSGSWTTTAVSRRRCVHNLLRCFQPLVPGTSQRDRVSTAPWISRESRLGSVIDDHIGQKKLNHVSSGRSSQGQHSVAWDTTTQLSFSHTWRSHVHPISFDNFTLQIPNDKDLTSRCWALAKVLWCGRALAVLSQGLFSFGFC